jgi:3-isopropylmalate/(R)-2-methylmalate dehydratase small subunit
VLNRPEYSGAQILVAGPNFGVGSSREHAVWALTDSGFRAVVSARFGDIFRSNATKTGLVPVTVSPEFGEALMRAVEKDPTIIVTVDIAERTISAPDAGLQEAFPLDDFTRYRLMEGLDDIGLTLRHADKIASYEQRRPAWMPRVAHG